MYMLRYSSDGKLFLEKKILKRDFLIMLDPSQNVKMMKEQ